MRAETRQAEPFVNPVPWPVVVLAGFVLLSEAVLAGARFGLWGGMHSVGWRAALIQRLGFSDPLFDRMIAHMRLEGVDLLRFVSHPLVHTDWREALLGAFFLLAIGKYAGARMREGTLALLLICGALIGALGFGLILQEPGLLVGTFTLVFALLGFYGGAQWIATGGDVRRAFSLPLFILFLDIAFTLSFGGAHFWVAHAFAMFVGLGFAFAIGVDGRVSWRVLRARLRRD